MLSSFRNSCRRALLSFAIFALLAGCGGPRLLTSTATLDHGVVSERGKATLRVVDESPGGGISRYRIRALDNEELAVVSMIRQSFNVTKVEVTFPGVRRDFIAALVSVSFEDLLAQWMTSNVFSDGHLDEAALERYCADRGVPLRHTRSVEEIFADARRQECNACTVQLHECLAVGLPDCQRRFETCTNGGQRPLTAGHSSCAGAARP